MTLAQCVFGILLALTLLLLVCTLVLVRRLFRAARTAPPEGTGVWPRAAILLPLRGADPKLFDGLRRLMRQDYPRYDLLIVVDSREDPAWPVVAQAVAETSATNVLVSELRNRRPDCSRQCSAFLQAAEALAEDCEVVITVDGDTAAHPSFLRELVAPLLDDRIGATFGNRWFMPPDASWGSLVRYLWNIAAVVTMYYQGIPWGGCMSIRRRLLSDTGLLDTWASSMVQDAPVKSMLSKRGLLIRFVPTLLMVNRDRCDLPFALDFIKRQMLWTKLYHPNWFAVILHGVLLIGSFLAVIGLIGNAILHGQIQDALWYSASIGVYVSGCLVMVAALEAGVRRVVRSRGEAAAWLSVPVMAKLIPGLALVHVVHVIALLLAHRSRRVTWRGVTYDIRGPFQVQVLSDQPTTPLVPLAADQNASL